MFPSFILYVFKACYRKQIIIFTWPNQNAAKTNCNTAQNSLMIQISEIKMHRKSEVLKNH